MPKKRKDGRYQAKVKTGRFKDDGTPGYKIVYGRTKDELDAAKDEAKKKAHLGDFRDAMTDEWLDEWLSIKDVEVVAGNITEGTYESYEGVVDLHIKPTLGKIPLENLQPQHIRKLLREKADKFSDRWVQYIYVVLNMALKQATVDRAILWNPCQAIKKPTITKREYIIITQQQYIAITEEAKKSSLRPLFMLGWDTGMRLGELLGLPWHCVDFKKNTVTVKQAVKRTKKLGVHISPDLKSKYAYRTLPVTAAVMAELKEHKKRQNDHINDFGITYNSVYDLVFPQIDGHPKDTRDVSSYFSDMVERLGLPPGLHFHDLRHTYATTLAEMDVHPKKMQILLGHASSSFTMDNYTHKTDDMLNGIREKLEKRGSQKVVRTHQTKKKKAGE